MKAPVRMLESREVFLQNYKRMLKKTSRALMTKYAEQRIVVGRSVTNLVKSMGILWWTW